MLEAEAQGQTLDAQSADPISSGRSSKIVAIIPAYNEQRFVGSVVLQVQEYVDKVIVVDDGSGDATAQVARAAGAIIVRHKYNRGKGYALNAGLARAQRLHPKAVVLIDADGQHRAEEIPTILGPILRGEADIVTGSRYLQEHQEVPRHRVLGHWLFTSVTNAVSGVRLSDSQNGFRALSARALKAIHFCSRGFSVECEFSFLIDEYALRVVEVPVTTSYPDKPKRNVVVHGLMVLSGLGSLMWQYRPLLYLGTAGLMALLISMACGIWVIHIHRQVQVLAVDYALIGILLSTLGSLSLFAGIVLHSMRVLLLRMLRLRRR